MTEYTVFDREKEEGVIFLQHRAEINYVGQTLRKHFIQWLDTGYGSSEIEAMGEDIPGFAIGEGGDEVDFDYEIYIVERYGSEQPENMSVNYAIQQMAHVGDSIDDGFTGASAIDVYSTFYCERPELPPEEFFQIVEDPADELIFKDI